MRKYFVRYRAIIGRGGNIGEGSTCIARPDAIRGMEDLNQIALDVCNILRDTQKLPINCPVQVDILSWQRFEEEVIALN